MLKKILLLVATLGLLATGCSDDQAQKADLSGKLSEQNPMVVDESTKSITILAKVNGKYFSENTRHAIVFKGGNFGDKPVFIALANQNDFYTAMMKIGAKPGNNMTLKNGAQTQVEGDKINISVTWDGATKSYDINEVIKDSNGKPIDMRFGGNEATAKSFNTGCIACLDSCPVGLISNHTYTNGAVEKRGEVVFNGIKEILPPDGTLVRITFKVAN
ncbi:YdjY domain-containing protein [Campylobacter mucosalis]|uniref:YdjY domain-containing protein n=1 Tax=Campylobacter mucosalis TaxID=202 RepID=UPI0014706A42|nr:YdjY domain-containing protein [Campylobacter mucosalis]